MSDKITHNSTNSQTFRQELAGFPEKVVMIPNVFVSLHHYFLYDVKMKIIDEQLISGAVERAKQSPRLRMNYNFHEIVKNPTGYCHLPESLFEFARKAKDKSQR